MFVSTGKFIYIIIPKAATISLSSNYNKANMLSNPQKVSQTLSSQTYIVGYTDAQFKYYERYFPETCIQIQ